jgi:hypothetical protein
MNDTREPNDRQQYLVVRFLTPLVCVLVVRVISSASVPARFYSLASEVEARTTELLKPIRTNDTNH